MEEIHNLISQNKLKEAIAYAKLHAEDLGFSLQELDRFQKELKGLERYDRNGLLLFSDMERLQTQFTFELLSYLSEKTPPTFLCITNRQDTLQSFLLWLETHFNWKGYSLMQSYDRERCSYDIYQSIIGLDYVLIHEIKYRKIVLEDHQNTENKFYDYASELKILENIQASIISKPKGFKHHKFPKQHQKLYEIKAKIPFFSEVKPVSTATIFWYYLKSKLGLGKFQTESLTISKNKSKPAGSSRVADALISIVEKEQGYFQNNELALLIDNWISNNRNRRKGITDYLEDILHVIKTVLLTNRCIEERLL